MPVSCHGPSSRVSHLSTLRGLYRWAVLANILDHDPTALVHTIRVPPGIPHPCPEAVLARALTARYVLVEDDALTAAVLAVA